MTTLLKTLAAAAAGAVLTMSAFAQSATQGRPEAGIVASPIYGVTIPEGYRDWKVISVSRLEGKLNQLRVELGNDIAIKAFQEEKRPFPDGAIVAALHWNSQSSEDNDKVFAAAGSGVQSFVAGSPANVQFMVKNSRKYAETDGWGFADFKDGKPGDEALHQSCFSCHAPAKAQDYVYTHYARTP